MSIKNDCRNLNLACAKFLQPRLEYVAAHHTSYPMGMDSDEWKRKLIVASDALLAYVKVYDEWEPNNEHVINSNAQDAMLFVAAYFLHLWD
jgi:hypothetical protein